MLKHVNSRRDFLKSSGSAMSATWLAVNAPFILAASQAAQANVAKQAAYVNLSAQDALELGAIVDQIIPPDETPGASDTGVVYFIDAAVGGFMADAVKPLKQGLKDLAKRASSVGNNDRHFSALSFDQQTAVLKEIEETRFFGTLHFLTMMGMFCLPQYAGNRDSIGWDLLGFDHQHVWQAPFGYYDAAVHEQNARQGEDHGS